MNLDKFSLCDLAEEIVWRSCQIPKIWLHNKNENKDVELLIDHIYHIYLECTKRKEKSHNLYIVVCDSTRSTKYSGTNITYPCTQSQPSPTIELGSIVGSSQG
jgi:hypothetical protein